MYYILKDFSILIQDYTRDSSTHKNNDILDLSPFPLVNLLLDFLLRSINNVHIIPTVTILRPLVDFNDTIPVRTRRVFWTSVRSRFIVMDVVWMSKLYRVLTRIENLHWLYLLK